MATARPMGQVTRNEKSTMTDEQVLEARALYEFRGWKPRQLQARYPHVDPRTLQNILNYTNRSRLIPTEAHLPTEV